MRGGYSLDFWTSYYHSFRFYTKYIIGIVIGILKITSYLIGLTIDAHIPHNLFTPTLYYICDWCLFICEYVFCLYYIRIWRKVSYLEPGAHACAGLALLFISAFWCPHRSLVIYDDYSWDAGASCEIRDIIYFKILGILDRW